MDGHGNNLGGCSSALATSDALEATASLGANPELSKQAAWVDASYYLLESRQAAGDAVPEALKRSTAEATLAAQLASLEPLDPQQGQILISKGNPTFRDNQYFTEDELLVWEEAFCRYALLGWPLDSGNMASMFNTALQHQGRKDDTGAPLRVSQSFTERFIQRSEQLSMYKSSNIDPQRVNKATAVVRFLVLLA